MNPESLKYQPTGQSVYTGATLAELLIGITNQSLFWTWVLIQREEFMPWSHTKALTYKSKDRNYLCLLMIMLLICHLNIHVYNYQFLLFTTLVKKVSSCSR